jgi:hypothetical protein
MAPELLDATASRCTCNMSLKPADVWSFAVMLFCMLTGACHSSFSLAGVVSLAVTTDVDTTLTI